MRIIDILTSPWAIQPSKLTEISGIYSRHLKGDKIDIKSIEAMAGQPLVNDHKPYNIIDGVAVIQLDGVIAKKMNLFSQVSGGVSTEIIANEVKQAISDADVNSIILNIDSPGGTVDGTVDLADIVHSSEKTIVALADGLMASAAYWIGSAAKAVYMTNNTATIGSIGVVAAHTDHSKADKKAGITVTDVYAGKYKRLVSGNKPLSKEGKQMIQDEVDYLYSIFVEAVAKHRGVDVGTVLSDMADGRVFTGQQAIDAGLVDGVITLDALIADLSQGVIPKAGVSAGNNVNPKEESVMEITKSYILDKHADIADALKEEGIKSVDVDAVKKGAATAECERIKSVFAQSMPGYESLIGEMAFDGVTTGPEAAVKVLQAEKQKRVDIKNDLDEDAPKPVPAAAPDEGGSEVNATVEEKAKAAWDKDEDLRSSFDNNYDSYLAYKKAEDGGQIRVLGGTK